jgi:hypothetical protein
MYNTHYFNTKEIPQLYGGRPQQFDESRGSIRELHNVSRQAHVEEFQDGR